MSIERKVIEENQNHIYLFVNSYRILKNINVFYYKNILC